MSVRPFNVYGPGQVGEGAIHQFIVQALRGEDLTIYNDGGQIRAWCYVYDMVEGLLACLERSEAVGQSFDIGEPEKCSDNLQSGPANCAALRARVPYRLCPLGKRRRGTADSEHR